MLKKKVMKKIKVACFQWVALSSILLLLAAAAPSACSKNRGNAANDLLDIINNNRTAHKLPKLTESAGLGCIALQYARSCESNCTTADNNNSNATMTHCQPSEDDFTEIFAPNCGLELPTFGRISGRILECRQKYLRPEEAFSDVLAQDNRTLSLLRNRSFTEVGVAIVGRLKHKGPYVWCVLLSDSEANTTFVLGDLGKGIEQKRGCYSGSSLDCSGGGFKDAHFCFSCFKYLWTFLLLLLML